ncbi:MAG: glycerophosphodiester phosphodiesterase [Oscillospiraceae bacterium]|nr:glycerophosphodiester phosphodiesterase [Oscillospiraceae bacterium]
MILVIIILGALCCLYVLSTICRRGKDRMGALYGWKYAHRGLHGNGVPENSMEAFRRAREHGYGVELDVHLLADGNLAIIHDHDLKRTTGKEGRIEELTVDQLGEYFLEGTMQTIPEFGQVLRLFDGRVPLIVELKAAGKNHAALCKKVCEMLGAYSGVFCLESFDPRCVYWLRKNRPDLVRGQLTENFLKTKTSTLPWILKFIMTFQITNFLTRPDFVAYKFKDRKHFSNKIVRGLWKTPSVTWTLVNEQELETALAEKRVPIFEGFEP